MVDRPLPAIRTLAAGMLLTAVTIGWSASRGEAAAMVPPLGLVQTAQNEMMQPTGYDDRGCAVYHVWSPSDPAEDGQVRYRRPDGSFTTERTEAACSSSEVTTGR